MPRPLPIVGSEIVLHVGIFQADREARCVDVNARWCEMAEMSREEALGHGWLRAVHPDDRERVLAEWEDAVRAGREVVLEYRHQVGARTIWVLVHAVPLRDDEQRVFRYVGTTTDITRAKVAEESAVRSATTLRALFDQLPDVVIVHRFGPIVFANAVTERALGYSLEELRQLTVNDLLHPDERESVRQRIDLLREARSALNPPRMTRMLRKDGGVSFFEVTAVRSEYELEPAVIAILHDVTARMARESQLRLSLQGFTDAFFILECVRDLRGEVEDFRIVELNRSLERLFGKPQDELANQRLSAVVDPETFGELFTLYARAQALAEPISQEVDLEPFGTCVQHQVLPLPNGVVATFHDTTEKRRAEERLRESEERWQFALEGSNQGVWDWNVETGDVFFSKHWKAMLGFEDDEIPKRLEEWTSRVHPDDLPEVTRKLEQHFRGETPYYEAEHRLRCKDGSYKWIRDRGCVT
ncbi:MAG: PAS domain S-box protein, partial [Polyangiaceae bacterium]|nr:PAS domain S-box protein [Polyangiaceae bacterium]